MVQNTLITNGIKFFDNNWETRSFDLTLSFGEGRGEVSYYKKIA